MTHGFEITVRGALCRALMTLCEYRAPVEWRALIFRLSGENGHESRLCCTRIYPPRGRGQDGAMKPTVKIPSTKDRVGASAPGAGSRTRQVDRSRAAKWIAGSRNPALRLG